MIRNALVVVVVALMASVVGLLSGVPDAAAQQSDPSATRSIAPTSVSPGEEVTVTIAFANVGLGRVTERLPDGFAYVTSSVDDVNVGISGQDVNFSLFEVSSPFTYTVTASNDPGPYRFSGTLNADRTEYNVGGPDTVTVVASPDPADPSATRSIAPTSVSPGEEVTVTIAFANVGLGRVTERLPDGFAYVTSSVDDVNVGISGQDVNFSLFEVSSPFTYTVTASNDPGPYRFSGTLNADRTEYNVGGPDTVTVVASPDPADPSATRSIAPTSVSPGGQVRVIITVANYGGFGRVTERLPDGFEYGSSSLEEEFVNEDGQEVMFTLQGVTSFNYTATASSTERSYAFSGTLRDADRMDHTVVGVSSVRVRVPAPPPSRPSPPSPVPDDDPCLDTLSGDGTVSGEWSSSCESTVRAGSYARYYSFTLSEGSEVTISLESSTDTYLYLRAGDAKSGAAAHENDDVAPGTDTNSRIEATLGAVTYTIEATTYGTGETGSFTLTVSGLGGGTTTMPDDGDSCLDSLSGDGAVSGTWSSGCESQVSDRGYARYYSFTLTEESGVTIDLESSTDPYLYLRSGEAKSGDFLHENDDVAPGTDTNSRIEATLEAGTYTIEATTYGTGETGSFTLTVSGLGGGTTTMPDDGDSCLDSLSGDGAVSGTWSSGCESQVSDRGYARYYSFTLTEESGVTIDLESSTDPYLYLRSGEAKSGDFLHENDDVAPGTDTNSRIEATLEAGTYTIEATTYSAGETGSFTLTVGGF